MFHSSAFIMASSISPEEDEPMHLAGLNMTCGSLQDILDGNDVNVSTALPTVPQDTRKYPTSAKDGRTSKANPSPNGRVES